MESLIIYLSAYTFVGKNTKVWMLVCMPITGIRLTRYLHKHIITQSSSLWLWLKTGVLSLTVGPQNFDSAGLVAAVFDDASLATHTTQRANCVLRQPPTSITLDWVRSKADNRHRICKISPAINSIFDWHLLLVAQRTRYQKKNYQSQFHLDWFVESST